MISSPIRILAFSDLHGAHFRQAEALIARHKPNWIVLAGDMLPDFHMLGGRGPRLEAQRLHWRSWRSCFLREDATTTFVRGNHELEGFEDEALRAVPPALSGRVGFLEGIPAEFGAWGFSREWEEDELQEEVAALGPTDIVISHVPPYGILDRARSGQRIGHRPLAELLESGHPPRLVICGHVHKSFGLRAEGRCLVVNAACGYALLEWDLAMRTPRLITMARMGAEV